MSREQPWSDEPVVAGRIVVVTENPIARAIIGIAEVLGRETVLVVGEDDDRTDGGEPPAALRWLADHPLSAGDALVLCDHDEPGAVSMVTTALAGQAGYVAMMGSRRRAATLFTDLQTYLDATTLARLHVPAGLDVGGRSPGEIALSVVAEIVAVSHGRSGGPMKGS